MAWSFATCGCRHVPFFHSMSEEFIAHHTPTDCELRDAHALFSSSWRSMAPRGLWRLFEYWVDASGVLDPTALGVLFMASSWSMDTVRGRGLERKLAESDSMWRFHDVIRGITGYNIYKHIMPETWEWELLVALHGGYRRLAALVQHVELHADEGNHEAVQQAVDALAAVEEGSWLRVASTAAGTSKAIVLEASLKQKRLAAHEIALELGSGVGRSSLRIAEKLRHRFAVVGVESDPVMALVSRHFIRHACLCDIIEIWIGHVSDILPRITEESGGWSVGFVFLDYRGSRFHIDIEQLESRALAPHSVTVAGGVLRPGTPLYLWRVHGTYELKVWAIQDPFDEEAEIQGEDWVAVATRAQLSTLKRLDAAPADLVRLSWQTDQMRSLAGEGSVEGADWIDFAEHSKQLLANYGIKPTPWVDNTEDF